MESQIKSVLIPTDFSESSERALAVGISIAKRQKAEVKLLHVLDSFTSFQPAELLFPGIDIPPDYSLLMDEKMKDLSEKITSKSGVKVTGRVLTGVPFEQICISAYQEDVSLIVIGSHGTSGIRKLFMGSDAYRVIKNAHCPVLTVPSQWDKKDFKKVLFPIRLIPGALDKYFYSRPIIEKNNSELLLLGITDMKDQENTEELMLLMGKLKVQLHNDNIRFSTSYCQGDDFPAEVAKTTREHNTDLILLTANIDTDWKSFFIGPLVQQVINHAQVPVLSIKPPEDKKERTETFKIAEHWGESLNLPDSD